MTLRACASMVVVGLWSCGPLDGLEPDGGFVATHDAGAGGGSAGPDAGAEGGGSGGSAEGGGSGGGGAGGGGGATGGGGSAGGGATTAGGGAAAPSCGDGVCSGAETCTSCAKDCGSCCTSNGALACGGNGIEGDPNALYRCDGTRYVQQKACGAACVRLPNGTPDRCPLGDPPASLVSKLSPKPYVETNCSAITYPGWPHEAKRCSYSSGGISTQVTVANPSPTQVAKWVVDASALIPALRRLESVDPAAWEQGLGWIAQHLLLQSSRIFPLEGGIVENMGSGYVNYFFKSGVTQSCSGGCYCRINSLHRSTYCNWRGATSTETTAACQGRVGTSGATAGWNAQCLSNHQRAWTQDWNEHFRAMAWERAMRVGSKCPQASSCTPAQVVAAVRAAYDL